MKSPESDFLKQKYDLHNTPEVGKAVEREEQETGEKMSQDPEAKIQVYLDRLERLALDPEKEQERVMFHGESRPRALTLLREMVMRKYVRGNKEKLAEGAAQVEERAAREMGIQAEYGEQELEERGDIAVTDLEKSLDNWISYLSDANEPYPVWFRYYTFRNILNLGDYDKDKGEFTKRSTGSTRLFPDIDRGALAYVEQMMEASKDPEMLERLKKAQKATANDNIPEDQFITKEKASQFAKFSFAKQYAEGIKQAGEITPEMREETRGEWKKYQKGTDPTALWASLQNKGTAWCTKGFGTAETQLKGGDFYVYYSLDKTGKPSIPRVAIRMQGEKVGEIRGVADNHQNLEGNMTEIAEKQADALPGAEEYKKKSSDMKHLTAVEKKTKKQEALTKDDLLFLYEMDGQIQGFGYERDPRITELRNQRNPDKDMLVVFECTKEDVARDISDITETTKAYVGPLVPHIFEKIQEYGIEHIYASFPEGRIRKIQLEVGGKTKKELEKEMKEKNIKISKYAQDMLDSVDFTTLKESELQEFIRLKVGDLGFQKGKNPTTDEIYARIAELGLELCPSETGPQYRLQYMDQPTNEWLRIGMKQISDRDDGDLSVWRVGLVGAGLWLAGLWTGPDGAWDPDAEFLFRLRKLGKLEILVSY